MTPQDLALHNRAVALMGHYDFEKAHALFEQLRQTYPDHPDLKVNHAISIINRQREGDEKLALGMLKQVLEIDKDNIRATYCCALLELYQGNMVPALGYFEKVLAMDPKDPGALYFLAKTQMQISRYDAALDNFKKVIELDPYLSSAYYGNIMTLRQLGRKKEAMKMIADYRKIKNNPRSRVMDFKYTKMGKKAEARTFDTTGIKGGPKPLGPLFDWPMTLVTASHDLQAGTPARESVRSMTVCDINGDGTLDLFLATGTREGRSLVLLKTAGSDRFETAPAHPLSNLERVNTALWGDLNDDGQVDVYLCRKGENQLWLQTRESGWEKDLKGGIGGNDLDTVDGAVFDADHDGDLDIFVVNADGPNELFNNNRDGSFRPLAEAYHLTGNGQPSKAVLIRDLDNDRDVDIFVVNQNPPHDVYMNQRLWKYEPGINYQALIHTDITAMTAADIDVDGFYELLTTDGKGGLTIWKTDADREWKRTLVTSGETASAEKSLSSVKLILADISGNGRPELIRSHVGGFAVFDLEDHTLTEQFAFASKNGVSLADLILYSTPRGPAAILADTAGTLSMWAPGKGRHSFFTLALTGRKDPDANLRTNVSGIGTKVFTRTANTWSAEDTFRNHSGPGQSFQPVCLGLNGFEAADFISLEWPDGVLQTEMGLVKNQDHLISETQRQMSSCPVLFAWSGEKYEFVSDILGVGGIGYAIGPGEYSVPRPWENFLLPEGLVRPDKGKLRFKITEPMEEVEYLDAVGLDVYDLPRGWSMALDERMGITGAAPTGKPLFYKEVIRPVSAVNERGQQVIDHILDRDLVAAPVGKLDRRFIGLLREEHALTIRFDRTLDSFEGEPFLIMDGWVEYPYSQTSFAAWQANSVYQAPSIDILNPDGTWSLYWDQMGYPAGMPRQMSLPLKALPEHVDTIRIRTNQEIYWDRIFVVASRPCPDMRLYRARLSGARLETTGFALRSDFDQRRPYYDGSFTDASWPARLLEGNYTRFGDVLELIDSKDNALAIYGPGEGVLFEFELPEPIPQGFKRAYVLNAHGWCKDMDLYTDTSDTVGPVPFDGSVSETARALNEQYNIRYQAGRNY